MSDTWYTHVDAEHPLTQGDIILDCPLITWKSVDVELTGSEESETLKAATTAIKADVVVMTQACDLVYRKVPNLIMCPHLSIDAYRRTGKKQ